MDSPAGPQPPGVRSSDGLLKLRTVRMVALRTPFISAIRRCSRSSALLQGTLGVTEFVNADAIASGLSAFNAEGAAIAAGRIMLHRLKSLARQRASFAFETTLSSRSLAPWLSDLQQDGYAVHMVFLWLSSPDLAVQRVADRVAMGGHSVPEETVRRRYRTGLLNFRTLYQNRTTTWSLFDSWRPKLRVIAEHLASGTVNVYDKLAWERIARHADED